VKHSAVPRTNLPGQRTYGTAAEGSTLLLLLLLLMMMMMATMMVGK